VVVLMSAALALWSITRITGGLADHLVFWVSTLGVLALSTVLSAAVEVVCVPRIGGLPRVATAAVVVTMVVAGVVEVHGARDPYSPFVRSFYRVMHEHMRSQLATRPVVGAMPGRWADAAGTVLLFRKAGATVGVTSDLDRIVGDRVPLEHPDIEFVLIDAPDRERMLEAGGGWTWLRTLTPDIHVLARPAAHER
jgi:hypothetical protein